MIMSTAKLNNFIAQIMAKHLECSREIIAWLPFLKKARSRILLSIAKLNNFIAQIMAYGKAFGGLKRSNGMAANPKKLFAL